MLLTALMFAVSLNMRLSLITSTAFIWELDESFHSLKDVYLPYEKCLVKIDDIDSNYSITNQKLCKQDNNEYPPTPSERNAGVFPACVIGFGHAAQGSLSKKGITVDPNGGHCFTRSMKERQGFNRAWLSRHNNNSSTDIPSYKYIQDMFAYLKLKNIRNIYFLGDSMNVQSGKFFGCDVSRTPGVKIIHHQHLLSHTNIPVQSATIEYDKHNVRIYMEKIKIPCTYDLKKADGCTRSDDWRIRSVYSGIKRVLVHAGASGRTDSPTIIVFNEGLHVFADTVGWMYEPMARALINTAKESRGKYFILFRETSAQHFSSRLGGTFDSKPSMDYKAFDFCCNLPKNGSIELNEHDWRNELFRQALEKVDDKWARYVGWVHFFNTTVALHDMHLELNIVHKADCTHFVYKPFIFLPLWIDLYQGIRVAMADYPPFSLDAFISRMTVNNTLVKGSKKAVYAVINGKKRIFIDWGMFETMGYHAFDIESVDDENLNAIPDGEPIAPTNFIARGSGRAIYLIQNGTKRLFEDWKKFEAMGYKQNDIQKVGDEYLNKMPSRQPIS